MARMYAVIMAVVGMNIVLIRGLRSGVGFESAVVAALSWMVTLGVIGFMVGSIARTTIDEAVQQQLDRELAALKKAT